MEQLALGDVTVARVKEYYGPVGMAPSEFFPDSPDETWRRHRPVLEPDFWDPATNECNTALQSWLLHSEGRTILVDTGVGNHKDRPYAAGWSRLDTDYLDNLAAAGVRPEDVDIVVNTHLHIDHVGWNTYLDGRTWVPTFPNATYLMPRRDFDFWNPANGHETVFGRAADSNALVFPAHLGGHGAAEVGKDGKDGSNFAIERWAGFSRIA
ncbi:hypothetical protein ABH935_000622 [Catenulispora sp. GAS73]|uniref:MBL fold metallo-hydrolase n=1 Tax=Catenulispora sp. GAS73 TaxID=3156269 RepID=UPI00351304C0